MGLSLKTPVVTHPGTSDVSQCISSGHISDYGQPPSNTSPQELMFSTIYEHLANKIVSRNASKISYAN